MGRPADITWNTIDELMVNRWNGTPDLRAANYATYRIPSPTGGTMQVYVRMNPRWCEVAVDRFRTTQRVSEPSESWFGTNIWPGRVGLQAEQKGLGSADRWR